jgi:hypothetical protein
LVIIRRCKQRTVALICALALLFTMMFVSPMVLAEDVEGADPVNSELLYTAVNTADAEAAISYIAITKAPTKTQYKKGEFFDPAGMEVTAYYDDETSAIILAYIYAPDTALGTSDRKITVSYGGKSAEQNIRVAGTGSGGSGGTVLNGSVKIGAIEKASSGETVKIPISLEEPVGIAGYGFLIQYDPDVLTPGAEVQAGTAIKTGIMAYNPDYGESGDKVFIVWADSQAITSSGSLAVLSFTVNSKANGGVTTVSWLSAEAFDIDGRPVALNRTDGQVKIIKGSSDSGGGGGGGSSVAVISDIANIEIKSPPAKLVYDEGEALDLTGLIVNLVYSDGSKKEVGLADFDGSGIVILPANGSLLDASLKKILVKAGNKTEELAVSVKVIPDEKPPAINTPVVTLCDIDNHWANAAIQQLVAAGIIAGYPDNTFRPDHTVTRAEFALMIVKALDLQEGKGQAFADTADHWAHGYIAAAVAAGIVAGYNNEEFGPDDLITREQMAVMIGKAAGLETVAGELIFNDADTVSDWARGWIAAVTENKLMSGYPDNTFKPRDNAARAEAVTVTAALLNR